MDNTIILELIGGELSLPSLLACTLVDTRFSRVARLLLQRHYFYDFDEQRDCLRTFKLDQDSVSYLHRLPKLRNLRSLAIHLDLHISPLSAHSGDWLAFLLPQLPSLQHLYLHGQHSQPRLSQKKEGPGRTDDALRKISDLRNEHGLPGLITLSISSSPDVTTDGFNKYLRPADFDPLKSICPPLSDSHCGFSLESLTLSKCPQLDSSILQALAMFCPQLGSLTLKDIDNIFAGSQTFPLLPRVHTICISLNLPDLPTDYFSVFRDQITLQHLTVTSSRHLTAGHISYMCRVTKLCISGCPSMVIDEVVQDMPNLREISYLGSGMTIEAVWRLWANGGIRKVTLDAVSVDDSQRLGFTVPLRRANIEDPDLPAALAHFHGVNLLSPAIPSWVLAYLLSLAPTSLESFSLHGKVDACAFAGGFSASGSHQSACDCEGQDTDVIKDASVFDRLLSRVGLGSCDSPGFNWREWLAWLDLRDTFDRLVLEGLPLPPPPPRRGLASRLAGRPANLGLAWSDHSQQHLPQYHQQAVSSLCASEGVGACLNGSPAALQALSTGTPLEDLLVLPVPILSGQKARDHSGPHRITVGQLEWLRVVTEGRLLRLDV